MTLIALKPTQQVADIVGALGGTWRGYTAMCHCPAHEDATPSLSVRQGHDAILLHCFAGCTPDEVLREIARLTLTRRFEPPGTARIPSCANVERLWADALPLIGTPAEHYLARRWITTPFRDLRYHPRCPWGPAPTTRFLPALLVAVREGLRLRAVQRIFLDVARGGYLAKVMLGRPAGGSWQGRPVTDTLALAEGFETAARFSELNGIPCWATLGASRLDRIHIPDTVTTLIFAEDNDAEGRRARRKAWSAYRSRGFVLRRMPPPERFGDWAEVDVGA